MYPTTFYNSQLSKQISKTTSELEEHKANLEKGITALISTLLSEKTNEDKKIQIIDILMKSLVLSGEITSALEEMVARGTVCTTDEEDQERCIIESESSLIAQAGLLKLNTEALLETKQDEWDMVLSVVLVVAGVGILAIPVAGPPILVTIGALVGGATVTGIGVYQVGKHLEIIGTHSSVFSLVKTVALRNVLAQTVFHLSKIGDVDLVTKVIFSSTEGEVISIFYDVISDLNEEYTAKTKRIAIDALLVFPKELQRRRTKFIDLLTKIIDTKPYDEDSLLLKISAVKVLGQIGQGVSEVEEYLKSIVEGTTNYDRLRLFSLFALGRRESGFSYSVDFMGQWLDDRRKAGNPVLILEVPRYYMKSVIESETKEVSINHIRVLREFVHSEILDFIENLELSGVLATWDQSQETKLVLKAIYQDPFTDINTYLEELKQKDLFKNWQENLDLLKSQINDVEPVTESEINVQIIESLIQNFVKKHSANQKIIEELQQFLDSYKKILVLL